MIKQSLIYGIHMILYTCCISKHNKKLIKMDVVCNNHLKRRTLHFDLDLQYDKLGELLLKWNIWNWIFRFITSVLFVYNLKNNLVLRSVIYSILVPFKSHNRSKAWWMLLPETFDFFNKIIPFFAWQFILNVPDLFDTCLLNWNLFMLCFSFHFISKGSLFPLVTTSDIFLWHHFYLAENFVEVWKPILTPSLLVW